MFKLSIRLMTLASLALLSACQQAPLSMTPQQLAGPQIYRARYVTAISPQKDLKDKLEKAKQWDPTALLVRVESQALSGQGQWDYYFKSASKNPIKIDSQMQIHEIKDMTQILEISFLEPIPLNSWQIDSQTAIKNAMKKLSDAMGISDMRADEARLEYHPNNGHVPFWKVFISSKQELFIVSVNAQTGLAY